MRDKKMCDNCRYWHEIGLGHFGTCEILAETKKWSNVCNKYNRLIKEEKT